MLEFRHMCGAAWRWLRAEPPDTYEHCAEHTGQNTARKIAGQITKMSVDTQRMG